MWPYSSEKEALYDALRLAKAMSYKAAISNLRLGGGKAVVIGNPERDKKRELFLALGEFAICLAREIKRARGEWHQLKRNSLRRWREASLR
jgi:glutamate dehydrogenase/leucine dehydrogenase